MTGVNNLREQGILLTIWLGLMLIFNAGGAVSYLLQPSVLSVVYPYVPILIFYIYGVISLINVVFVVFLFMWKRWAFFAICESTVFAFLLNIFVVRFTIGLSLLGLAGHIILYFLLRSKWKSLKTSKCDRLILISLFIVFIILFSISLIGVK